MLTAKHLKYTHTLVHSQCRGHNSVPSEYFFFFLVKYILWEKEIWFKYQTTWMDWQISSTSVLNDEKVKLQIGIREARAYYKKGTVSLIWFRMTKYLFSSQVSDPESWADQMMKEQMDAAEQSVRNTDRQLHSSNITVKKSYSDSNNLMATVTVAVFLIICLRLWDCSITINVTMMSL